MDALETFLKAHAVRVSDYNSCNAWGFGGAVGKVYELPRTITVMIAKAYCRVPALNAKFLKISQDSPMIRQRTIRDVGDSPKNRKAMAAELAALLS